MIQKLERLIDAATLFLEMAAVALKRQEEEKAGVEKTAAPAAAERTGEEMAADAKIDEAKAKAKAPRKPRAPKAPEATAAAAPAAEAPAAAEAASVPEMTEEESAKKINEATLEYVRLAKNDTPDGKTVLMGILTNEFKVGKLGDLTHPQRVQWIERVTKMTAEHK